MSQNVIRMPEARGVPKNDPRSELMQELIFGFHILDLWDHLSGMGSHMTARLPGAETMLYHLQGFGFGEVTPDHIHEADFELNVLTGDQAINPTLHIHTRSYMARPEINCIVHTHSKFCSALSAIGANFDPTITQNASRLYDDCVFFDEEDGIAIGKPAGQAIADGLGDKHCMLLKNHGLITVGKSVREAVVLAITLEQQAEVQLLAMAAGKIDPMSDDGARRTRDYLRTDERIDSTWQLCMRRLARERPEVLEM